MKREITIPKSKPRRRRRSFGALRRGGASSVLLPPSMRMLCPNLDREDGLDTVLEVPIPEEMFSSSHGRSKASRLLNPKWNRPDLHPPSSIGRQAELQLMLGVIGAPLVPLPIQDYHQSALCRNIKDHSIEVSMAKYIVQQYIAAVGGEQALSAINSMYAMGKVRMTASEIPKANGNVHRIGNARDGGTGGGGGIASVHRKAKKVSFLGGEIGGFVFWQKKPELWCLEMVVSGCKISAGSDGKVAWRQTPWHQSHASRGPPRPLRRSLQGLDPRSTANLFANSVCLGEKTINGEDSFVLRLDAEAATLRARSSTSVEIIRHTVWGYFSQRSGLLVQLEDSHLLRIRSPSETNVFWETTMESSIEDYRLVDGGVYIAHAGQTNVSLFRFGETSDTHTRTRMEEVWMVEEVDFNVWGLSMDFFLPPGDLKDEKEGGGDAVTVVNKIPRPPPLARLVQTPAATSAVSPRIGPSQVAAFEVVDSDKTESNDIGTPSL